ncbi:P-loop containing nucleoside triphosphate hydrolase protein [Chiua virens]|nr:P-loop containing nucleoside triphosphate hydrolase protein [Chiua virens]
MSMRMQTLILIALLDRPDDILADELQSDFWHLTERLFEEPNPVLSDNERQSINAMISSVQNTRGGKAKQRVIESAKHPAGYAALLKWHAAYKFNPEIYRRVQRALEAEELSPHKLIWNRRRRLDDFPSRSDADGALDAVACEVFGENCLANQRIVGEFKEAVSALIHHEWERQRKKYAWASKTLVGKKLIAQSAFREIEKKNEPTASEVRSAIKALKAYKDAIYWFPKEEEEEGGVVEMMCGLEEVLQTAIKASRKLPPNKRMLPEEDVTTGASSSRGKRRVAHVRGIAAAAAGDIEEIWATYVQLFGLKTADQEQLQSVLNSEEGAQDAWVELADLGVEKFVQYSEQALSALLNFPDASPALFAKLRSSSALCAWDAEDCKKFVSSNPDMKPLRLLWHQLVGIASVVDKAFTAEATDIGLPGVLIADAVGVGKTALTMGVIAFIIDAFYVQEAMATCKVGGKLLHQSNVRLAPIIEKTPCFAGHAVMENLPHVIVVSNSLVRQWISELQTFFAPGKIEIYIFPTAESKFTQFWDGDWRTSKTPHINRIILVPHSVMTTFGRAFDVRRGRGGKNANKATDEQRHIKLPLLHQKFISRDRTFTTVVVDEAHEFRNATANWYVVLELTKSARLPLLLTATPLFTSPQDLCNLGRLLRIPQFCGKEGDEREIAFIKQIRSARRGITRQDKAISAEKAVSVMIGKNNGLGEIQVVPSSIQRVRFVHGEWIDSIRACYGGRVIRRTVESKRHDGRKINDSLPPYRMVVARLALTEKELTIIRKVLDGFSSGGVLETIADGEGLKTKFYLEGRTKAAFPFHESPSYPVVTTRAQYSAVRSTKADMLVAVVLHHLSTNFLTPVSFERHPTLPSVTDSRDCPILNQPWVAASDPNAPPRPLWTPLETDEGQEMPQLKNGSRKVLVYHEFAMMAPLILSILKVYGVDAAAINGTQTVEERDRTVLAFQNDKKCRVLLFSNVGAVGLNLTAATVVILFDQCWSRLLVNQIIGRAWRLGQTEEVVVYNLVCDQTVDCLMTDCAQGKGSMLEQFLATRHGHDIKRLLGSGEFPIEELPPEGAGADSNSDVEIVSVSHAKINKRDRKLKRSNSPREEKNDAATEITKPPNGIGKSRALKSPKLVIAPTVPPVVPHNEQNVSTTQEPPECKTADAASVGISGSPTEDESNAQNSPETGSSIDRPSDPSEFELDARKTPGSEAAAETTAPPHVALQEVDYFTRAIEEDADQPREFFAPSSAPSEDAVDGVIETPVSLITTGKPTLKHSRKMLSPPNSPPRPLHSRQVCSTNARDDGGDGIGEPPRKIFRANREKLAFVPKAARNKSGWDTRL